MPWAAGLTSELQEGWTIAQQEPTRCRTKAFAGWLLEHENRASNINLFETVARLAKALTHRPQYRQQSCPLACQAICMNISVELLQSFPRTILHLTCASLLTPLTLTTTLLLFPADGIASSTTNDLEVDSTVEANSGFEDSPKAVIDEAWQIVHQEYVDGSFNQTDWQLTRQELLGQEYTSREAAYSALRGALQQLNDPYTRFLSPSEYSDLTDQTSGEVSGIGIYVQKDSTTGDVLITEVASGSPAEQADLRVGDKIMLVDGQSTARLTLQGVSQKLRGEEGSQVTLTISRNDGSPRSVVITRARIEVATVEHTLKDFSNRPIGYIRLLEFNAHAAEQMEAAIRDLQDQGVEGFVLDLRGNPGGLLLASIDISRMWLQHGPIVDRESEQRGLQRWSMVARPVLARF